MPNGFGTPQPGDPDPNAKARLVADLREQIRAGLTAGEDQEALLARLRQHPLVGYYRAFTTNPTVAAAPIAPGARSAALDRMATARTPDEQAAFEAERARSEAAAEASLGRPGPEPRLVSDRSAPAALSRPLVWLVDQIVSSTLGPKSGQAATDLLQYGRIGASPHDPTPFIDSSVVAQTALATLLAGPAGRFAGAKLLASPVAEDLFSASPFMRRALAAHLKGTSTGFEEGAIRAFLSNKTTASVFAKELSRATAIPRGAAIAQPFALGSAKEAAAEAPAGDRLGAATTAWAQTTIGFMAFESALLAAGAGWRASGAGPALRAAPQIVGDIAHAAEQKMNGLMDAWIGLKRPAGALWTPADEAELARTMGAAMREAAESRLPPDVDHGAFITTFKSALRRNLKNLFDEAAKRGDTGTPEASLPLAQAFIEGASIDPATHAMPIDRAVAHVFALAQEGKPIAGELERRLVPPAPAVERRSGVPRRLTPADMAAGVAEERRLVARREIEDQVDMSIRSSEGVRAMAEEAAQPTKPLGQMTQEVGRPAPAKRSIADLKAARARTAPRPTITTQIESSLTAPSRSEDLLDLDSSFFENLGLVEGTRRPQRPVSPFIAADAALSRKSAPDLAEVRTLAQSAGYDVRPQSRPSVQAPGTKAQPVRVFEILRSDGTPVATTDSLQSALADIRKRASTTAGAMLASETANQTVLADDPEDTPDERKFKAGLRNALRIGSTLPLLAAAGGGRPAQRIWRRFASTFEKGLATGQGASERRAEAWLEARRAIASVGYGLRTPEEVFRNWHPSVKNPTMDTFRANRHAQTEFGQIVDYVNKELTPSGLGRHSDAGRNAGALLDAIDTDLLLKLPTPTSKAQARFRWQDAIRASAKLHPDRNQRIYERALDAVDALPLGSFRRVKEMAKKYRDLRERSVNAETVRFMRDEGKTRPYAIVNEGGGFVRRVRTKEAAERAIESARKKGRALGWQLRPAPTEAEIEERLGKTMSAYLPHVTYDALHDQRHDIDWLIESAPWSDPTHIVAELQRLAAVNGKKARRAAFETTFGPLEDDEFHALNNAARQAIGYARSGTDRGIAKSVPREFYVKFYQDRINEGADYHLDAANALLAYAYPVLRDIHIGPTLPPLREALQNARLNPALGASPDALREVTRHVEHIVGRERKFDPNVSRLAGLAAGAAYSGVLWMRLPPAIANLMGQGLIGASEMGADTSLAALIAMTNPKVRASLATLDPIARSLPIGRRGIGESFRKIVEAGERSLRGDLPGKMGLRNELSAAIKESGMTAGDFMALTEAGIRQWGYLGGLIEAMKKDGTLPTFTIGGLRGSPVEALKNLNSLPEAVLESHTRQAEDTMRRVAYFFDSASSPSLIRKAKDFPGGPLALQFTNFPINYGNRLISNLADTFGKRVPPDARKAAATKLARLVTFSYLTFGPAATGVLSLFGDEVSEFDEGLGARWNAFIKPYQRWWDEFYGRRDVARKFGVFSPVSDLVTLPAPVPKAAWTLATNAPELMRQGGNVLQRSLFGTDVPIDPAGDDQVRAEIQRIYGAITPYATDEPGPEDRLLPEALSIMIPGGLAAQEYVDYLIRSRRHAEGLPAPLDPQYRLRTEDPSPGARLLLGGQSVDEKEARLRARSLQDQERKANTLVRDYLHAEFTPVSEREYHRATQAFEERPELLGRITPEAIRSAMRAQEFETDERALLAAPRDLLLGLEMRGFSDRLMSGIEYLPVEDQKKRRRLRDVFQMALAGAKPAKAPK